jgi:dephospho-CoA kinase
MTFRLGLTGSIGMGKSTTARMFAEHDIPVWDADAAVHRLYRAGGAAVGPLGALFPEAIRAGGVDRTVLKSLIAADPAVLGQIEAIVHPLVAADRQSFVAQSSAPLVVFDVPLLFETGSEGWFDAIAVVSVAPEIQAERVMSRPGMTRDQFDTILARQMPDAGKRARADYIIDTTSMESARAAVLSIISSIGT